MMPCSYGFGSCNCFTPPTPNGFTFEATFTYGSSYSATASATAGDFLNCRAVSEEVAGREGLTESGILAHEYGLEPGERFSRGAAIELTQTIGVNQLIVVLMEQTRVNILHGGGDLVRLNLHVPPDNPDPLQWRPLTSSCPIEYEGDNGRRWHRLTFDGIAPSGSFPYTLANFRRNDAEKAVFSLLHQVGNPIRRISSLVIAPGGPGLQRIEYTPNVITAGTYPFWGKGPYEIVWSRNGVEEARAQYPGTDAGFAQYLGGKVVRLQGWVFDASVDFTQVLARWPIKARLAANSYRGWAE